MLVPRRSIIFFRTLSLHLLLNKRTPRILITTFFRISFSRAGWLAGNSMVPVIGSSLGPAWGMCDCLSEHLDV